MNRSNTGAIAAASQPTTWVARIGARAVAAFLSPFQLKRCPPSARWVVGFVALSLSLLIPACGYAQAIEPAGVVSVGSTLSLDGRWEAGEGRHYDRTVTVPGLAQNPGVIPTDTLWYRRKLTLPGGDWTTAELELKGARFAPTVYVDGERVSSSEGGMAPTVHLLRSAAVAPGRVIELEIALKSLRDLDPLDASATPGADRWRTNVSSGLWDSVNLHFSGDARIARLTPWTDFKSRSLDVRWKLDPAPGAEIENAVVQAFVTDLAGREIAKSLALPTQSLQGSSTISLGDACQMWTPDTPALYRLRLVVMANGRAEDVREMSWGLRDFRVNGLQFSLNGDPVQLREGTIVWHRFLRDPEAPGIAWNTEWFQSAIFDRLHGLGANTVRFHLGLPPEALLDRCDRTGLMVQLEWPFFHGIGASQASMEVQYRAWFDVALRHPSVVLLHPWNETGGEQLKRGHAAIAAIAPEFPPLVISHRDVLHVHKYWWSLFENLGLYYDSVADFPQPIVADEFGGNYLDGDGNPGGYPATKETFLRFLGRDHTREMRLRHHAESNGLIAEYWRRLGAAGFSPFCILGGPQDGNHWFIGPLRNAVPKPVWAALAAAYSPQSVSIAYWNRNFTPGEEMTLPLHFFNDRRVAASLHATVRVVSEEGGVPIGPSKAISANVSSWGTVAKTISVRVPDAIGEWRIEAQLDDAVPGVTERPKSSWRFRTFKPAFPEGLRGKTLGIPESETELRALFAKHGVRVVGTDDRGARTLVFSATSWAHIAESPEFRTRLETAVNRGQSVVLLDIGPRDLERYQAEARKNLEGAPAAVNVTPERHRLFAGLDVVFRPAAEPESHLHPSIGNDVLWTSLPAQSTWMWNGLRGGLVVPASEMEVGGLSASAFIAQWIQRGASPQILSSGRSYYAYELAGYYAFSELKDDSDAIDKLRKRVAFIVEDAPSLQGRIDPNARVLATDLAQTLRETAATAQASELIPLANCGKNLTRVPVVLVTFGTGRGKVALSQLLTAGRLLESEHPLKLYELGYDPSAEGLVLNLVALASSP